MYFNQIKTYNENEISSTPLNLRNSVHNFAESDLFSHLKNVLQSNKKNVMKMRSVLHILITWCMPPNPKLLASISTMQSTLSTGVG